MSPAPSTSRRPRGRSGLRLVVVVLAAALLGGAGTTAASAEVAAAAAAPSFSDVAENHPFYDEIEYMAAAGISEGYEDGTYRPSAAVSRQAMAAFLYRLDFEPPFVPPGTPTFSDVPVSSPFYLEVEWMVDAGIADGFPDGTFRPTVSVSRQAMSSFMFRLIQDRLGDGDEYVAPVDPSFADVPPSNPFYDSIEWMLENEISVGYGSADGPVFRPSAQVTRQAMSAFMARADVLDW